MRTYFKLITFPILIAMGLSSCLDEKHEEQKKYTGVWKLDHYYEDGTDQTISHISGFRDHAIDVEADYSFNESWISDQGPAAINGTWSMENKDEITLKDKINGSRTFHLKYTFYLSSRSNGNEWIFRKL